MAWRILLVSGSLRKASTNSAALRTAIAHTPTDARPTMYDDAAELPHFNPDDDGDSLDSRVAALRGTVHDADALLFSVPEYAGALPGSFKNVLDWLIGDDQPRSISEKPVAWINVSPRGAALAHESLRVVLTYANASIVEDACVAAPVPPNGVGPDGLIADPASVAEIVRSLAALARHLAGPASGPQE